MLEETEFVIHHACQCGALLHLVYVANPAQTPGFSLTQSYGPNLKATINDAFPRCPSCLRNLPRLRFALGP